MTEGEAIQTLRTPKGGTPEMTYSELDLPANKVTNGEIEAEEIEKERDVLPAPLNALLASLWVLLFGGRWLFVPLLQAAGVLSVEQVAAWDEGLLYKTYLILLFLTCIVLALRAARTASNKER